MTANPGHSLRPRTRIWPGARGGSRIIDGVGVGVRKHPTAWALSAMSFAGQAWLRRHKLLQARFSTRREALLTFAAYHATDPAPAWHPPACQLTRQTDGSYHSADGIVVRRAGPGWTLHHQDQYLCWAATLLDAAQSIAAEGKS